MPRVHEDSTGAAWPARLRRLRSIDYRLHCGKCGALGGAAAVPWATCISDRTIAMQLRSFIFAGLAAALCLSAPAYAAMPASTPPAKATASSDVLTVAAKSP